MSERDMQDLVSIIERRLGVSWGDVIEWLRQQNGLDELERRLATGDMASIVQSVDEAAAKFAADIHAGYVHAGQETAKWLDGEVEDGLIRFDVANTRAAAWADKNAATLVRGLTTESRETVRQVIADGVRAGANPREIARDLRDSIGLTPSQAQAVANYRTQLETGDYSGALDRALSGAHSDRTIAAAQRADRALTSDQIDLAVERYRSNYVSYRAEVIARTEALRAVHAGNHELYRQAIERGDVDADQLTREWNHAGHGRNSRPGHVEMQDQERGIEEPFENPLTGARLMYPGDPDADVSETACCRCAASTRYVA